MSTREEEEEEKKEKEEEEKEEEASKRKKNYKGKRQRRMKWFMEINDKVKIAKYSGDDRLCLGDVRW